MLLALGLTIRYVTYPRSCILFAYSQERTGMNKRNNGIRKKNTKAGQRTLQESLLHPSRDPTPGLTPSLSPSPSNTTVDDGEDQGAAFLGLPQPFPPVPESTCFGPPPMEIFSMPTTLTRRQFGARHDA